MLPMSRVNTRPRIPVRNWSRWLRLVSVLAWLPFLLSFTPKEVVSAQMALPAAPPDTSAETQPNSIFLPLVQQSGPKQAAIDAHVLETQTKVVRWGPFVIPAASNRGPGISNYPGYKVEMPCTNCFITSMALDLVREDGSPFNYGTEPSGRGSWMVVNLARADDAVCGSFGELVFLAGNERSPVVLPTGYGYFNPSYSSWIAGPPPLQNYSEQPISVYLDFTATFVPGTENVKHTTFVAIDQLDCDTRPPFYAIPAGYTDTHKEWTATRGGEIVTVVGHMHDYGISDALENVTTGQPICISRGGYAEGSPWAPVGPGSGIDEYHPVSHNVLNPGDPDYAGHIERTDICFPGVRVERGDILRLHTQYNSPMPMADAMGTMFVLMHVTDAPPCTLAIAPIYRDNTLWLLVNLGKSQAVQGHEVTWNLWSVTNADVTPLMSEIVPLIDPQKPTVRAIPNLPPAGIVGFLSTLTTSEGIICSDWRAVDTGPASADSASFHSALSSEILRDFRFEEVLLDDEIGALSPTLNPQAKAQSYQANTGPLLNTANGHYYEAVSVPEGIDWWRAGLEAEQREFQGFFGHIATVTSQQENSFIAANFPEIAGELGYWLGGIQHLDTALFDKGWRWVTGEFMGYINWHAGEPNDPGGPDAIHYYTSSGEWSDRPTTDSVSGYVVEYEPTCSLAMDLAYEDGILNLSISAHKQEPTKWNLWLVVGRRMIPIVSAREFPDNESQLNFSMSTPFPHSGRLGFLATLTTADGVVCSEWKTVETPPR